MSIPCDDVIDSLAYFYSQYLILTRETNGFRGPDLKWYWEYRVNNQSVLGVGDTEKDAKNDAASKTHDLMMIILAQWSRARDQN